MAPIRTDENFPIFLRHFFRNILPLEEVDLNFSDEDFLGLSEFAELAVELSGSLSGLSSFEDITLEEIEILSEKVDLPMEAIADYLKSSYIKDIYFPNIDAVTHEHLYGLMRFDLPYEYHELLNTTPEDLTEAIELTSHSNIISPALKDTIAALIQGFKDAQEDDYLVNESGDPSFAVKLLEMVGITNRDTQKSFLVRYTSHDPSLGDFWELLMNDGVLTSTQVVDAKFVFSLSVVTQQYEPLIQRIWDDPAITQLSDLPNKTYDDWINIIHVEIVTGTATTEGTIVGIPFYTPTYSFDGAGVYTYESAEDVEYVEAILNKVERLFASGMLNQEIGGDSDFGTTRALINSGDYDIRDDSPRIKLASSSYSDDEKEEVFRTRRLFHLFGKRGRIGKIKYLKDTAGIYSASRLIKRGRRKFIKRHGLSSVIGGREEAEAVFRRAMKRNAAAIALHGMFNPGFNQIGTRVSPVSPIPTEPDASDIANNPQLNVFFGSQDFCDCQHCQSSTSPAAYLVDLLEFLKEAENNNTSVAQSAWEILKDIRRPDLGNIELTCDNTNKAMPYIDLVNEVLEYAIAQANSLSGNADRQTSLDQESLKVIPEHVNKEVYDFLASQIYPISAPLHLWNEESRSYLNALGIKRSDIIQAIKGNSFQGDDLSIEEACVYLNISDDLRTNILSSTAFSQFYDVSQSSSLHPVQMLLTKTGISYDELLEFIESEYVNPTQKQIVFTPASSCSLDDATLDFDPGEYITLHKFIRLRRLVNWSVSELDIVLKAFGTGNVVSSEIIKLAGLKKLQERFNIPIDELAVWFSGLSLAVYGEKVSQYEQVYLSPVYNVDPEVRQAFSDVIAVTPTSLELVNAGVINQPNLSVVLAALEISSQDLILMMSEEGIDSAAVDYQGLSHLHRLASFLRVTSLSAQEYLKLKSIFGKSPCSDLSNNRLPADTLAFLTWLNIFRKSPLDISDLSFIFKNDYTVYPKAQQAEIVSSLQLIRNSLIKKFSEKGIGIERTETSLLNLLLIVFDEQSATTALEIIKDPTYPDAESYIDNTWSELTDDEVDDLATIKAKLVSGGSGTLITDLQERIDYGFQIFHLQVASTLGLANEVVELIAVETGSSPLLVKGLMEEVDSVGNPSRKLIATYMDYGFIFNGLEINEANFPDHINSFLLLHKMLLLIEKLGVDREYLPIVIHETSKTGWFDITTLPLPSSTSSWDFSGFIRLIQAFEWEAHYSTESFSVVGQIKKAIYEAPATVAPSIFQAVSDELGWGLDDINFLAATTTTDGGFGWSGPDDYMDERWFGKLESVFAFINTLGVSAEQLSSWRNIDMTYDQAQAVRSSVRARYSKASWQKIASEIRDKLRILQRDALSVHLIANNPDAQYSFKNTDDLYSYYLIDTEMAPCALTSRIKLATSTIQLWVQRIRMGLEPGIAFDDEDMDEWEWRKNYRVWEAGRKVFMYPENWIEPELRDDKTLFFQEMEDELLQGEVTAEAVEAAYLGYLKKLDQVANLEVISAFQEKDQAIFHVFARTRNEPHIYFHRTQEDGFEWSDWRRVDVDIEGNHLVPVIFNRRLMLFWPMINEAPVEVGTEDMDIETTGGKVTKDIENKVPVTQADIMLYYTEWSGNKWQPKKISKSSLTSSFAFEPQKYFFKPEERSDGLHIGAFFQPEKEEPYNFLGSFYLNNCTGELRVDPVQRVASPSNFVVSNTERHYTKLRSSSKAFELTESFENLAHVKWAVNEEMKINRTKILNKGPYYFDVVYPIDTLELLSEVPFFYDDGNRVFMVDPSDETFSKSKIISLKPYEYQTTIVVGTKPVTVKVPVINLTPKPKLISFFPPSPVRYKPLMKPSPPLRSLQKPDVKQASSKRKKKNKLGKKIGKGLRRLFK